MLFCYSVVHFCCLSDGVHRVSFLVSFLGWFEGLSKLFLSCTVPKLLLLAGVDRLDKDLTIGQMQGNSYNVSFCTNVVPYIALLC